MKIYLIILIIISYFLINNKYNLKEYQQLKKPSSPKPTPKPTPKPSNYVKTTSEDPYADRKGPSAYWSTPTKDTYTLDGLSKSKDSQYLNKYSEFGLINFDQPTIKKNMYLDKPCSQSIPKEDLLKDGYCNIFKDKSLDGHKNDKEINNLLCPSKLLSLKILQ